MEKTATTFASFSEFYPFYLNEHRDRNCRRLHFVGTTLVIATAIYALFSGHYLAFLLLPVFGYSFAWVGHFYFEKNCPATFEHPFYSLMGDFVMYRDVWLGRVKL